MRSILFPLEPGIPSRNMACHLLNASELRRSGQKGCGEGKLKCHKVLLPCFVCLFFFDEYSFDCCKFLNIFQNFNKADSDNFLPVFSVSL